MPLYSLGRFTTRLSNTIANEEFNTEEDIEYIKEFTDPETNKTSLNVSMHGSLYSFGSRCLWW